jgi:hypothetical protein
MPNMDNIQIRFTPVQVEINNDDTLLHNRLIQRGIMTVRVKLLICTGQNKQRFQVILNSIINLYAHKGNG